MNREFDRGELQDRLVDLVHGTLTDAECATVEAAIANDPELARELDIVRDARTALTPAVAAINTDQIIAAIRRPARRQGLGGVARWRIAAAIATLAVGGASLAVVNQSARTGSADSLAVVGESLSVGEREALSLTFGYNLSDMSAEEIEKLITQLEKTGGVPSTEPRTNAVVPPVMEDLQ